MANARFATVHGILVLCLLSSACSRPDSVRLDGAAPSTVWAGLPAVLPSVTVLDAKGRPLPNAYAEVRVAPASKARIEGQRLIAIHDGPAEVQWLVTGTNIVKRAPIEVRVPDGIEIVCPGGQCNIRVGERLALTARAKRGGVTFEDAPLLWTSSAPETLAPTKPGEFMGKAPGPASVSVHLGTLSRTVTVRVSANQVDSIRLGCKRESGTKESKNDACVVQIGRDRPLDVRLFGLGHPAFGFEQKWTTNDDSIVDVVEQKLVGHRIGRTKVSVEAGGATAKLAVEVWPAACEEKVQEILTYIIPGGRRYRGRRKVSLACRVPAPESCIRFYREDQVQTYPEAFESCCCVASLR